MSDKEHDSSDCSTRMVAESDTTWIDNIIATLPSDILNSRSYYYKQYPGIEITYSFSKFMHTVPLGIVTNTHSESPTFVAVFGESMLLTWIGLQCRVQRLIDTSYTVKINAVNGTNPYECHHEEIFTFVKVPLPVSRYEPSYVRHFTAVDHVDTGQDVHIRVHNGHNIELKASFSTIHQNCCSLLDTKVVLKVQHPSRVGGAYDHSSWDTGSFDRTFNHKKIT